MRARSGVAHQRGDPDYDGCAGSVGYGETLPHYTWGRVTDEAIARVKGGNGGLLGDDSLGAGLQMVLYEPVGKAPACWSTACSTFPRCVPGARFRWNIDLAPGCCRGARGRWREATRPQDQGAPVIARAGAR